MKNWQCGTLFRCTHSVYTCVIDNLIVQARVYPSHARVQRKENTLYYFFVDAPSIKKN